MSGPTRPLPRRFSDITDIKRVLIRSRPRFIGVVPDSLDHIAHRPAFLNLCLDRALSDQTWSLCCASVAWRNVPDVMNSILTVTTAATDRALLTTAELRDAVGASLTDPQLTTLGNRVAAAIARACGVTEGGAVPVTLRLETLTETFRARHLCRRHLMLSRRPVVAISLVTEDVTIVVAGDYELDAPSGLLHRLSSRKLTEWPAVSKIVVVYSAGYDTVPDDLKDIAARLAATWAINRGRDLTLKRERVDGVAEQEFWVDPDADSVLPDDITAALRRGGYVNDWVA
jgi:hypothetical protein